MISIRTPVAMIDDDYETNYDAAPSIAMPSRKRHHMDQNDFEIFDLKRVRMACKSLPSDLIYLATIDP